MKNILAAVDFSDVTDSVVAQAAQLAESFQAKLWLIHIAAPDPEFVGYGVGPQHERDWRAAVLRGEHQRLQEYALNLDKQSVDVTPLLIQGYPIDGILREAERRAADLVILGSHGHGTLYTTLMGSVSRAILQDTRYPVLIVPFKRLAAEEVTEAAEAAEG